MQGYICVDNYFVYINTNIASNPARQVKTVFTCQTGRHTWFMQGINYSLHNYLIVFCKNKISSTTENELSELFTALSTLSTGFM
jgi:hypothetical protein